MSSLGIEYPSPRLGRPAPAAPVPTYLCVLYQYPVDGVLVAQRPTQSQVQLDSSGVEQSGISVVKARIFQSVDVNVILLLFLKISKKKKKI